MWMNESVLFTFTYSPVTIEFGICIPIRTEGILNRITENK